MNARSSEPGASLVDASRALDRAVRKLSFTEPVTHVYNPLEYAWEPHLQYLERWGSGPKEVVLVGMNPGPFGMAQTGVPFGDVSLVRDFLGIEAEVKRPKNEHPKRPVLGFDCPRSEVSGSRLWGWARDRFGTAEAFFARFFVLNYCPLVFMEESGRNRTPDKLPRSEREPLEAACDRALAASLDALSPKLVIGVGAFAEKQARKVWGDRAGVGIGCILHPSPASPRANRDWAGTVELQLRELGVPL